LIELTAAGKSHNPCLRSPLNLEINVSDDWPRTKLSWTGETIGPDDFVHAVGVCLLLFNQLETALIAFLMQCVGAPRQLLAPSPGQLGGDARARLDDLIAQAPGFDAVGRARLAALLEGFAVCAENQALVSRLNYRSRLKDGRHLVMILGGPDEAEGRLFSLSLESLRAFAGDLNDLFQDVVSLRVCAEIGRHGGLGKDAGSAGPSWPEALAPPVRLETLAVRHDPTGAA
jgi:hypothetical protein